MLICNIEVFKKSNNQYRTTYEQTQKHDFEKDLIKAKQANNRHSKTSN